VLPWRKTDKQTWRIELNGTKAASVEYELFGNTMANDWTQYNSDHAYINGPAVWMYLVGGKTRSIQLKIKVPQGWRVATGMGQSGEGNYNAPDYDTFADCPIEISDFAETTFSHAGKTYHIIVHDHLGRKPFSRFASDVERMVKAISGYFDGGQVPFQDYWFLTHVWAAGAAGLEHLNSTSLIFNSNWDDTRAAGRYGTEYDLKLFVTAHEFYHAWNVKRLRPKPLGPFDYTKEVALRRSDELLRPVGARSGGTTQTRTISRIHRRAHYGL
jgi:predicted metalloprotease with PDZ domain